MPPHRHLILTFLVSALLPMAQAAAEHDYRIEQVAGGLEHPWSLAFLPDGRMLVTERGGDLVLIDGADQSRVANMPAVHARGQGGLLDVIVDPDFSNNQLVYLSFSALAGDRPNTRVVRARLDGDALTGTVEIFTSNAEGVRSKHFGSRLAIDGNGHLFITHGDLGVRENAQDASNHAGSVIRINTDGSVPADNPFVGQNGIAPELFSTGNRNPQGMAINPATGVVWSHEHGPQGGDEINIIEAGKNYGWPVITYCVNYGFGTKIGDGITAKDGMEQPIYYWDPSIAPSGMMFYTGDQFPEWQGDLFIGALKYQLLVRLELDGDRIVSESRIVDGDIGRVRDVRQGPDGYIYLLNDQDDGGVYRLVPAG